MYKLNHDLIIYIISFLFTINDYTNVMLINKEIFYLLYNYNYKKIRLNNKLIQLSIKYSAIREKNEDDLYYQSSFNNSWNRYNCIVSNCQIDGFKDISIGIVYIYILNSKEYYQYINNNLQCLKNKNPTLKFIPYCKNCVKRYINIEQYHNKNNYLVFLPDYD